MYGKYETSEVRLLDGPSVCNNVLKKAGKLHVHGPNGAPATNNKCKFQLLLPLFEIQELAGDILDEFRERRGTRLQRTFVSGIGLHLHFLPTA